MKRILAACAALLLGVSTLAFAEELHHASEGRLSIGAVGATVTQVSTDHGQSVSETYRVKPDHTLTLIERNPL
jgi:outer membrane lipoprotein-sorting protein